MLATTSDPTLPGLRCLRTLWDGQGAVADRVRKGIAETRAALPCECLPIVVIHSLDDGLVPAAFNSAPYVARAKAAGRDVRYWQVRNALHFDAFLGFSQYGAAALCLCRIGSGLGASRKRQCTSGGCSDTTPRGVGKELDASHLAIPRCSYARRLWK